MSFQHPNSHVPQDFIEAGLMAVSNAFRGCGMEAKHPPEDEFGCDSFLYGEMGAARFLVYVRVTCNDDMDPEDDAPPGILIDAAREIGAEPHLVDVHVSRQGGGMAFSGYRGYQEFIRSVKSHGAEWNRSLLKGKTVGDFLRLKSGALSKLEIALERVKGDEGDIVRLRLRIDGMEPYGGTICPYELLKSTTGSDMCDVFTCSCGEPGCAGIFRGIVVVHEDKHTLWKAYHAKPRKIFVFDRLEYRREILSKCAEAIQAVRKGQVAGVQPWEDRFSSLESIFFDATEDLPGGGTEEPILVWSPNSKA